MPIEPTVDECPSILHPKFVRRFENLKAGIAVVPLRDFRAWLHSPDLLRMRITDRLVKRFDLRAIVVKGSFGQAMRGHDHPPRIFALLGYATAANCPIIFIDQATLAESAVSAIYRAWNTRAILGAGVDGRE